MTVKYVPDTSVLIDGRITKLIDDGELSGATIIIPEAVISELEAQANQGREIGFKGLNELKSLAERKRSGEVDLIYVGRRPTADEIKLASVGEIDAMIRTVAVENDATFITSDIVQSEVAALKGWTSRTCSLKRGQKNRCCYSGSSRATLCRCF